MELIGRHSDIRMLDTYMESDRAEFIAVYGRRRVGKTFLIDKYFNTEYAFSATGIIGGTRKEELGVFHESLKRYGYKGNKPKSWMESFSALVDLLEQEPSCSRRKVIFLDELPCFATQRAGFVRALDHFWNDWASKRSDIFLIVCGSATSWIVRNLIDDKGGLHNRITHEMHLSPFTLADTAEYLSRAGCLWDEITVLQTYMILGGIPYYLSLLNPQESLSQNIDRLFFSRNGELKKEYKRLYKSLFKSPERYMDIVRLLSERKSGMTRSEIADKMKSANNGHLTEMLEDLVNCDFIRQYNVKQKKISSKNGIYQLTDLYSIFYQKFGKIRTTDEHYWSKFINSQKQSTWWGLAFERVCQAHIPQILTALGVQAVHTEYYSWRNKGYDSKRGAQIDLVIERDDRIINICEIKYCLNTEYELTLEERDKLTQRIESFRQETETRYGIIPTLITTYGLRRNKHSDFFRGVVITIADLAKC